MEILALTGKPSLPSAANKCKCVPAAVLAVIKEIHYKSVARWILKAIQLLFGIHR